MLAGRALACAARVLQSTATDMLARGLIAQIADRALVAHHVALGHVVFLGSVVSSVVGSVVGSVLGSA